MVDWYCGYITDRRISFEMNGVSRTLKASWGFSQGGVCSALFWIIAFNPAVEILNKYGINGNGFADDCAAVFGGTHFKPILVKLQRMLDELV